jgi:hypothetical protein
MPEGSAPGRANLLPGADLAVCARGEVDFASVIVGRVAEDQR